MNIRIGTDTGDTVRSLLRSAVHLPGARSLPQPTMSSNGQGGIKDQGELGGFFGSPQDLTLPDMREDKTRVEKQTDITDLFKMENNLLKLSVPDSVSIITTSDTSVLGNLPLPDLFPQRIKQEVNFSLDKDLETSGGQVCDLDGNSSHLIEDTEIWKELDLPSSLPEISDFDVDTEVAHLTSDILLDSGSCGAPVGSLLKDTKSLLGNGINCTNMNGENNPVRQPSHQQQQQQQHLLQHQQHKLHREPQSGSLLSSVMIKQEKNSFIHIRTPGVVKQEKEDSSAFCQMAYLQNEMSSARGGGTMSSSSVGASTGAGYLYGVNPASAAGLQDQKPSGIYPNLPVAGQSWSRFGESAGPRGDDAVPSASALGKFPINFSR